MRSKAILFLAALGVFAIDQGLKDLFVSGYEWHSRCLSLELHYNRGVAFSFFAFLGPWLKWIQALIITGLLFVAYREGWTRRHPLLVGLLVGAALGNLYDRFVRGAVADYVYWHCGFDFAVFNFADVMIDLSIGLVLLQSLWMRRGNRG